MKATPLVTADKAISTNRSLTGAQMLALKKKFLEEINNIQIQPVFRCVLSSNMVLQYFLILVFLEKRALLNNLTLVL